jgi:Transposase IS116/IS110/IS902 family
MGIPGVGPLVAITFKSAIDNPGRIVKSKTVGALFGLVPKKYQSGQRDVSGGYEAIGELLIANPIGILVERDELISLLQHLDREDQAVARGFYLSAWQYPARPHRRIRPPLARLFLRFRHIRNVERFASFRQRDPRIPQALIVFAL